MTKKTKVLARMGLIDWIEAVKENEWRSGGHNFIIDKNADESPDTPYRLCTSFSFLGRFETLEAAKEYAQAWMNFIR